MSQGPEASEQTPNGAVWKVFRVGHGFSAFAYVFESLHSLPNPPLSSFS